MVLMPSCQHVRENLTEYLEGKLPLRERMGIRLHLLMCTVCDGLLRRLKALPNFAKSLLSAPSEAPAEAKETFHHVLENIKGTKTS